VFAIDSAGVIVFFDGLNTTYFHIFLEGLWQEGQLPSTSLFRVRIGQFSIILGKGRVHCSRKNVRFEVLSVSEATDAMFDGHDSTVHPFGHGVGDLLIAGAHDILQALFDRACFSVHRKFRRRCACRTNYAASRNFREGFSIVTIVFGGTLRLSVTLEPINEPAPTIVVPPRIDALL